MNDIVSEELNSVETGNASASDESDGERFRRT